MTRRHLSRRETVAVFDAAGGVCRICAQAITAGQRWHVDHIKPLWLGGADELANMAPLHDRCHMSKTAIEARDRAKGNRVRQKHLGIPKRKARPLPGTIASGWRHRMSGKWERR